MKVIVDLPHGDVRGVEIRYEDGTVLDGVFDVLEGEFEEGPGKPKFLRLLVACDPRFENIPPQSVRGGSPEKDAGQLVDGLMAWWWQTFDYEVLNGELRPDTNSPAVWG